MITPIPLCNFLRRPLCCPHNKFLNAHIFLNGSFHSEIKDAIFDRNSQLRNKVIVGSRFPAFHIAGNQNLDVFRNTALGKIVINGASG